MIFSWLVFRACVYCWFIHALKCGSVPVTEHNVILQFILTFNVTILVELLCATGRSLGTNVHTWGLMLVSSIGCIILFEHLIKGKELVVDSIYPYINLNKVCACVWSEVWPLCNYFILVFNAVKVKKFIFCVVYFTTHSVIAVYFLDSILNYSYTSIYPIIEEIAYSPFDTNYSSFYPEGYFHPKWLNPEEYDKPTYKTQIVFENIHEYTGKCQMLGEPTYTRKAKFPIHYEEIYRYIGEDVSLRCQYVITGTSDVLNLPDPLWRLDNKFYTSNNSRREIFHEMIYSGNINDGCRISSILNIFSLKESDFGEYLCLATLQNYRNVGGKIVHFETIIEQTVVYVFDLKRIRPKLSPLYKSVGTLLLTQSYYSLYTNDFSENVFAIYSANNISVDKICPQLNTRYCTLVGYMLNKKLSNVIPFTSVSDLELTIGVLKRAIAGFCLCSESFGIHQVTFIRKIQLSNKKYFTSETVHPHTFVVLPHGVISLFRYFDDKHLYSNIEKMVENGEPISTIENELNKIRPFIASNEEKILTLANLVQIIMFILTLIIVCNIPTTLLLLYGRVFVRLPIISFVGEHMILDGIPQVAIGDNSYNIFLSNSEDDMIFVNETILPFLENECRLRVCVPERDFNPGVALFSTYHRSIKQSEKVIIVLSESYLTDLNCAHLLLEHIIVPLVNDKESKPKQVLIIQIDNAIEVPDILKYNSRFKSFLWKADSQLEDSLYVIKDWLFSEKSVQCVIT